MVVSTCYGCGISRTFEEFQELKSVTKIDLSDAKGFNFTMIEGEPWFLEVRNCDCKSTLSIGLNKDGSFLRGLTEK